MNKAVLSIDGGELCKAFSKGGASECVTLDG